MPEQALVETFLCEDAEIGLHPGTRHEEMSAVDLDHGEAQSAGAGRELLGYRPSQCLEPGNHGSKTIDVGGVIPSEGDKGLAAAGQTAMGVLILDASHGRLDTIATLTSRQPRNGEPPNSLEITQISPGKITATDIYCQSTDANCCPSGKTTARWTYHNGTLTPDTP